MRMSSAYQVVVTFPASRAPRDGRAPRHAPVTFGAQRYHTSVAHAETYVWNELHASISCSVVVVPNFVIHTVYHLLPVDLVRNLLVLVAVFLGCIPSGDG